MFEELGIEAPKTWSEVEAVATAVSDKIGKPGFGFQILVDANRFEDLIAMNALYRPGPMEYIPNFMLQ